MKAKEYAEKYSGLRNPNLSTNEYVSMFTSMFREIHEEFYQMCQTRQIKKIASYISLKEEFNQKCNAIANLLNGPIKQDWFLCLMQDVESEELKVEILKYNLAKTKNRG